MYGGIALAIYCNTLFGYKSRDSLSCIYNSIDYNKTINNLPYIYIYIYTLYIYCFYIISSLLFSKLTRNSF